MNKRLHNTIDIISFFGNHVIKFLIFLPLIFLFIPSMYIGNAEIPVYDIIIGISVTLLLLYFNISLLKNVPYNNLPFKFLVLYIIWVLACGIILVCRGSFAINNFLYGVLILFLYNDILWYIYPILLVPNFITLSKLRTILLVGIYIICVYGLLVYLDNTFGFGIFSHIQDIINNRRETMSSTRNLSVFEEPGYFGGFICINLPFIYKTVLSKYFIVKNRFINSFLKKSYIPLIFINIITIQSPIWFVFCILSSIIYFQKNILQYAKKQFVFLTIIIVIFFSFFALLFKQIDTSNTFINRMVLAFKNLRSFELLINAEPSLGTRIISYRAKIYLALQHPITGVGYKNANFVVWTYFENVHSPLTHEIITSIANSKYKSGAIGINGSILWDTLSNTGFVGTILLYSFYISSILLLNKVLLKLKDSIEKNFIAGIKLSLISVVVLSFYDIRPNFVYFWFLFGLVIAITKYYNRLFFQKNRRTQWT